MDGSQLFEVWAPQGSVWSRWAKPALFTAMPPDLPGTGPAMPVHSVPSDSPDIPPEARPFDAGPVDTWTAFVLDLPGARSVEIGLALARAGWRPVPMFNTAYHAAAIVPVSEILRKLHQAEPEMRNLVMLAEAPPAFLLDAKRLDPSTTAAPGKFDNRWVVFPQDFPSASFLLSQGIRRVVVLQADALQGKPRLDLAHVLLRWREAGIELYAQDPDGSFGPQPMQIDRPSSFRSLFYRALTLVGLRRNSAGGFGSVIPQPSSSSGRSGFG
ncbi:MAG TPA: hypothetical protein VN493_11120 [Thermoanaerobaculia bacterium]|nr:hypothetical protein [Thermoanaerobaculia bacterium]